MNKYILLFRCKDRPGVVEDISKFVTEKLNGSFNPFRGEHWEGNYAVRTEFEVPNGFPGGLETISKRFSQTVKGEDIWMDIRDKDKKQKAAVLVSGQTHCLKHLLNYWEEGDLNLDISAVISNHDAEVARIAHRYNVNFFHVPVAGRKEEAEKELLKLTQGTDFLVLARYMQILSPGFIASYGRPIINVHHGDVAAFPGAKPYHQAHARGVKSLHPTAHYVIAEVDAGPIIESIGVRVNDTDSVEMFMKKGKAGESDALLRAVDMHANSRVIIYGNKTLRFIE
jgi:formyltetrahydrofolate deformylase